MPAESTQYGDRTARAQVYLISDAIPAIGYTIKAKRALW